MRFFDRWRPEPVPADVGRGFWVAEAPALQRSIVTALADGERSRSHVSTQLQFSPGADERVVVVLRNVIVGFVPPAHAAPLRRQLQDAGKAPLVADGSVVEDGGMRRIWVGTGAPDGPPPADELAPPPVTIFGMALRDTAPRDPAPPDPPATTTARRRILAVGIHSWDVRDGTDLDVELLRRRLAESAPGATLHVRIWEEAVTIHPNTSVTLTDPMTGAVEVLR